MALAVEDGTGLATAESYLAVADFKTMAGAVGFSVEGYADDEIEAALRRASSYIDNRYGGRWPGFAMQGRVQALSWPRTQAADRGGNAIGTDEIPREVKSAVMQACRRELAQPDSLTPDKISQRTLSESIGPISVRYQDQGDQRPLIVIIEEILAPLLARPANVFFAQRA
jgi:hypothetical protein